MPNPLCQFQEAYPVVESMIEVENRTKKRLPACSHTAVGRDFIFQQAFVYAAPPIGNNTPKLVSYCKCSTGLQAGLSAQIREVVSNYALSVADLGPEEFSWAAVAYSGASIEWSA